MRTPASFAIFAIFACSVVAQSCAAIRTASPESSGTGIVLDGRYDDWRSVPVWTQASSPSDTRSPLALQRAWSTDDDAWWYLSIEVSDSVNALAMPGTLHLLVDADAQETTGATVLGTTGVDFSVDLSRTDKVQGDGFGTGSALRTVSSNGLAEYRNPYDNGFVVLPSWSSTRFELRMQRTGAADAFAKLGMRVRARFVHEAPNGAISALPVATYEFRSPAAPVPAASVSSIPRKDANSTRIVHWNVSEGSFREPARHAKLLAAVAPDIVMLDEAFETISDSLLTDFFARRELAALGRWQFVHSNTGGRQKTVIATRVGAIRQAETMRRVEYDAGALDSLRPLVPDAFKHAMDIEAKAQLSSTGAWVVVGGIETLFVPVDLQSGGFHDGGQDKLRLLQSRTLHARIEREFTAHGGRAPVVIGGDFNSVGSYAPLRALLRGLDVNGSDLALAEPLRLGDKSVVTWASATGAQFSPGRLDCTLYSDSAFERTGGFVFTSSDLSPAFATTLGLTTDMSPKTSDHMIVVTDLRRRR